MKPSLADRRNKLAAAFGLGTAMIVTTLLLKGWPRQFALMIDAGTVLAVSMLILSRPGLLRLIGPLPFLSPNWLTLWRVPIVACGEVLFLLAAYNHDEKLLWAGFLIVVFGLTLDRIDGKMAQNLLARLMFLPDPHPKFEQIDRYPGAPVTNDGHLWAWYVDTVENEAGQKVQRTRRVYFEPWITRLSSLGTKVPMFRVEKALDTSPPALRIVLTGIGEWLDPLVDKINFLPLFAYLCWIGYIPAFVGIPAITVDLFSTIIREPFLSMPGFRRLQGYVREAKASPFGKTKIIWQFTTLLAQIPAIAGWLNPSELYWSKVISGLLMGLSLIAGVLSVLSRTTLMAELLKLLGLGRFNRDFRRFYEHDTKD